MAQFNKVTTLLLLAGARGVASSAEHSNTCVPLMEGILPCSQIGFDNILGLYPNLYGCCSGLRQLVQGGCQCNPLIDGLLGGAAAKQQLFGLEPFCRFVIQPWDWVLTPLPMFRGCDEVRSVFDYGCDVSDVEIDGARFASIELFEGLFLDASDEAICFDTNVFVEGLRSSFTETPELFVPYGAGLYQGAEDIAEYFGIPFNGLNHGMWQLNTDVLLDEPAQFSLSQDGLTWNVGVTQDRGTYFRGGLDYPAGYFEQQIQFEPCETKISRYNVMPTLGLRDNVITTFAQIAQWSKRYGIEDICRYHTEFCAGSVSTKQYDSESECLDYMRALPLWTDKCGKNRLFQGASLPCKWKHHLMLPANPQLHCSHIGKIGTPDMNGNLKCDDDAECSEDEGQDTWPDLVAIGDATPATTLAILEANNIDFQQEPFGCAIPIA